MSEGEPKNYPLRNAYYVVLSLNEVLFPGSRSVCIEEKIVFIGYRGVHHIKRLVGLSLLIKLGCSIISKRS